MTTPTSYRTRIRRRKTTVAEWVSLNPRPTADREAIAADIGEVIAQAVPVLCICCDAPATVALGDWDVCAEHYNALTEPEPDAPEQLWP
jgi:hypothetical protein